MVSSLNRGLRVAVVGSGPGGFYTAKSLLKQPPSVVGEVTMIERLPCPYGLVRFGVAPDHQEVKNVTSDFDKVASDDRFRFVGNLTLSSDHNATGSVTLKRLRHEFDAGSGWSLSGHIFF